ncbi:hypothetical protein R1flu_025140 [Riccia fluitans]|uniref:Uncharacterized protein n=1 Tax=Riccia fluitans TaxID=41844 RepID=A0ABD1XWW0_9MARC
MTMAVDMEDEYEEDMPISNPMPPPSRPGGGRDGREDQYGDGDAEIRPANLSNEDFRRMVMETPRKGDERGRDKPRSRSKRLEVGEEEDDKRNQRKFKPKLKEEEKPEDPEQPRYRDRAKERREDVNPDYDHTAAELGSLHAVAPPGTVDLRTSDAHRISIENSKFLGGDVEHTHLVKGLDYALLHKVRSEIDKQPEDQEVADEGKRRQRKEDQVVSFRTATAKVIYQLAVKQQTPNKLNEMFLPGRTAFVFDMDEEFSHDIPTTVHRSKADCPVPQETVTVGVDGTVLERIAKIMAYLRLGASGKLKKKKKEKGDSRGRMSGIADDSTITDEAEKAAQAMGINGFSNRHQDHATTMLPPPPPRRSHFDAAEQPKAATRRNIEDDIFEDAGTDYQTSGKGGSPLSEDMEESPREGERNMYFDEPAYGPAPPQAMGQEWHQQGPYNGMAPGAALPSAYPTGEWSEYPPPPPEHYAGPWPPEQYQFEDTYAQADFGAAGQVAVRDPRFMTQEEKDRGLGSVFKRDDQRLQQRRERDAREKDPNFISESYSECYPGYQEYNREIVDSDEDEDLTKMDMGGRAKGRLHRWDFETEEEWATYNEQKEAMPKAAFQFGVKMQDGRKTRKQNKDQKLNNELHRINQILDRKKKDKSGGGGSYDDERGGGDDDGHPGKRLRM